MTFIDWSDSEEMFGLLSEYVADEKTDSHHDRARETFLTELLTELLDVTERLNAMSADEAIERLRAIHHSQADDFVGDPVLAHIEACIEELERIRSQSAGTP